MNEKETLDNKKQTEIFHVAFPCCFLIIERMLKLSYNGRNVETIL